MSRNFLSRFEELRRGDYLISNNGNFKAVFQDDGNFVIYNWKPVWASDTSGSDVFRLCMQEDCNLVMYTKDHTPRWHTNSHRPKSDTCRLQLSDNGNLEVYKDGELIWSSSQNRGMK